MSGAEVKKQQASQLQSMHDKTIANIKDLQELEKHMFLNLQKIQGGDDSTEKKNIETKINTLSAMRVNLFTKLKSMYTDTQASTDSNRKDLADQITMVQVMEEELNNVKTRLEQLKSEKSNKIRMVQLGDYEYDRYTAHKKIFKNIVYGAFAVLIVSYLMHLPMFPTKIGVLIIILIVAWVIISISGEMYDNAKKDNLDYDKYDQGEFKAGAGVGAGDTGFLNRNSKALESLFKSKCKNTDGFHNMEKFMKVVIPAESSIPTTYAPLSIY
jgi:hypothetical protein